MTKEDLIKQLKEYKVKSAKLKIMELKYESMNDLQKKMVFNEIYELQRDVNIIQFALDSLKQSEYELVSYKYFNDLTIDDIADKMLLGTATVSRKNKEILNNLLDLVNIFNNIDSSIGA
ncbi:MAG: hypothetical protein ACRDB0_08445 [Paraclostridium sp.]